MILVFGSINVDLIIPVPHLPEPGETVLGGDYALLPGGKGGNQALAARRGGAAVMLAGAVGRFHLLKYGLSLVLIFVGLKMVWLNNWYGGKFPITLSLGIISFIIMASILLSFLFPKASRFQN